MVGRQASEQDRIAEGQGAGNEKRILLKTFYIVEPGILAISSPIDRYIVLFVLFSLTLGLRYYEGAQRVGVR
jgi:hypothetical protein